MYQLRAYCTNKYTVSSGLNLKIRDAYWYPPLHPDGTNNGLKNLVEIHLGRSSIPNFQVPTIIYILVIYLMFHQSIRGLLKT
jgi:hypothetical protein